MVFILDFGKTDLERNNIKVFKRDDFEIFEVNKIHLYLEILF